MCENLHKVFGISGGLLCDDVEVEDAVVRSLSDAIWICGVRGFESKSEETRKKRDC